MQSQSDLGDTFGCHGCGNYLEHLRHDRSCIWQLSGYGHWDVGDHCTQCGSKSDRPNAYARFHDRSKLGIAKVANPKRGTKRKLQLDTCAYRIVRGTVNLTCSISPSATPAPTCSLSSSSVQISGSGAQSVAVRWEPPRL